VQLTWDTLNKLGMLRTVRIGASYLRSALFPIKPVTNLEDFFINRFGRELYLTFFKSYTEKVWGVPCEKIRPDWGAQRIKGLFDPESHYALREGRRKKVVACEAAWFAIAISARHGRNSPVGNLHSLNVEIRHDLSARRGYSARDLLPHLPRPEFRIKKSLDQRVPFWLELVRGLGDSAPASVREISEGLQYRDFIAVGLLLNQLRLRDPSDRLPKLFSDDWIYIQEPDVLIGRLQIFNNWSPYMVGSVKGLLGAEYFCQEGDELWRKPDQDMAAFHDR
jgi:hypothetical protein